MKQSSPESQGKLDISGGVLDAEKLLSDPANQIGVCVGGCAAHAKQTHSRFISFLDDKLQKFRVRKERQECKKLVLVAGGNKSKYPAEGVNHGVQRAVVEWARGKTDVLCVCALSADMVEYKTYVDPTACGDNVVFLQTHTGGSERRKWIGKTAATAAFVFVYAGGPGTVHEVQCMVAAGIDPSRVSGSGVEFAMKCAERNGHADAAALLARIQEGSKGLPDPL